MTSTFAGLGPEGVGFEGWRPVLASAAARQQSLPGPPVSLPPVPIPTTGDKRLRPFAFAGLGPEGLGRGREARTSVRSSEATVASWAPHVLIPRLSLSSLRLFPRRSAADYQ